MVTAAKRTHSRREAGRPIPRLSLCFLTAALLLFTAGCGDPTGPDAAGDYRMQSYLWPAASPARTYVREENGTQRVHELNFSGRTVIDVLAGGDGSQNHRTVLDLVDNGGGMELKGCDEATMLHLPSHVRFRDIIVTEQGPEILADCWLRLNDNALLAADGSRLFQLAISSNQWTERAVPWTSAVQSLALDSNAAPHVRFAGTSSDGLFLQRQTDSVWTPLKAPTGSVQDIAVDIGGTIFAVIDETLYLSRVPYDRWTRFNIEQFAAGIRTISLLQINSFQSILYIGSSLNGIAHVLMQGSYPVQFGVTSQLGNEGVVDLQSSADSPYGAVAVADPPMLYLSPGLTGLWASVPLPGLGRQTAVCQSDRSAAVLLGTTQGMYRFDGAAPTASGLQGSEIRSIRYGPGDAFYCGTSAGSYRSADEGRLWTRIDKGSVATRISSGLTLLPSVFSVSSSWVAGSILQDGAAAAITGRVLSRFDELLLPGETGRFYDVMVVRYAVEAADATVQSGSYSWTIYYAAGLGPVYVEEHDDGILAATTRLSQP